MKTTCLKRMQHGFTLVEIAIVLLIVAILLGYTVALFPVQQELKQYRQANTEMDDAIEHLIAFAQVNGRLPCPDTSAAGPLNIDGLEDQNGANDCDAYFGFLPGRTLGIIGDYSADGRLLDPWGTGYGYAVSPVNTGSPGDPDLDLVTANGVRNEGMAAVIPDLFICDNSPALGNDANCAAAASNAVMSNVAVVVVSLGKDGLAGVSNIQQENYDDFHDGSNDKVYVSASRSDVANAEFDDVVKWIPTTLLFSRMIQAEQLP